VNYAKAVGRIVAHPAAYAADAARYILNDVGSALGLYRSPVKTILVVGLPKSGSTWVHNMMLDLPGFNPRYYEALYVKDEHGRWRSGKDADGRFLNEYVYDNIDESFFESAPRWGHSAYKFHARASERNISILEKQAPKWIVTYRDLRDVCVSRYFHFKSDPHNQFYPLYQQLSQEQALQHTAEIIRNEFVPWVQGWRDVAKRQPGRICEVKYEDLWTDTQKELERILAFYGIEVPASYFSKVLATKLTESQDLKTNLQSHARLLRRNTARKGGVGGWKEYISGPLKEEFKKFAGATLIELGYEQDMNW
jgi:hypothetical protein